MDAREIAVEVRKTLKETFPGWKFSVTSDYSSLTVAVMSGPESPFADQYSYCEDTRYERKDDYAQLNHYYIEEYGERPYQPGWQKTEGCRPAGWYSNGVRLTEKAAKMLQQIVKLSNVKNYDNSDLMTDYFDVGYYFNLHIGKWDKPFTVK